MTSVTTVDAIAADRSTLLFPGKYLSVTTFRLSGEPVATPVWFVEVDGRLYVDTDGGSGKVSRIRANPHVLIAPCTAAGRLKTPPVAATAEITATMPPTIRDLYLRKYRVDRVLVLPLYRLVQRFKGHHPGAQRPVVLVITPTSS